MRVVGVALAAALVLLSSGCVSSNRIVANRVVQSNTWYGELGITGVGNDITVQRGSDLTRLSIIGDFNRVRIEPRSTCGKIEIWGKECQVFVPAGMVIRKNVVGHGSEVVFYDPKAQPAGPGDDRPWIEELPNDDPYQTTTYTGEPADAPARGRPGSYPGDAADYTTESAPEAGVYEEMQPSGAPGG